MNQEQFALAHARLTAKIESMPDGLELLPEGRRKRELIGMRAKLRVDSGDMAFNSYPQFTLRNLGRNEDRLIAAQWNLGSGPLQFQSDQKITGFPFTFNGRIDSGECEVVAEIGNAETGTRELGRFILNASTYDICVSFDDVHYSGVIKVEPHFDVAKYEFFRAYRNRGSTIRPFGVDIDFNVDALVAVVQNG